MALSGTGFTAVGALSPDEFVKHVENKLAQLWRRTEQCEAYRLVAAPETDPRLVISIAKHVLLEVFSYGPHVTEATFTAIGRLPKNRPDLMKAMIHHDLEEVDHGEMALQDFIKLGGNEEEARSRQITPASFVMAATCRMIGERENPFGYLGYMFPFECLTPIITTNVQKFLAAKGFPVEARNFIDVHAEEDIGHAIAMKKLVARVVGDYPDAAAAIDHAFDCFVQVYPVPIWDAALQRARLETGHS